MKAQKNTLLGLVTVCRVENVEKCTIVGCIARV